jgi:putative phosphonate catabolism associated alcohol dehydrogenase
MNKTKVAVFENSNLPIEVLNIEIPEIGAGQILVKVEYVTLCKSDVHTYCGKRKEKTPTILGHEIVGRISKIGPNFNPFDLREEHLEVGDRITWAIFAANPENEMAKKGIPQKASDLFKYGHEQITTHNNLHGGLAEFIILRANTPIIKIKEDIPLQVAALINCSIATVAGAIRLAGELNNKKVLISGSGMLGVVACAMCQINGASAVFALDIVKDRIETAKSFGANQGGLIGDNLDKEIIELYDSPNPFDVILELSGQPSSMEITMDLLDTGGVAVWVGATYPERNTHINAEKLIRNIHTIKGLHNYNNEDFINAVNFVEKHFNDYPFTSLIYDHYTLSQVNDAFAHAIEKKPYRVGIRIV